MMKPNPINEAYQRLAAIQRDYEEAHARTLALERELLAAQNELSRLQPAEPGGEVGEPPVILGACYSCGRVRAYGKTQWVGKCRRCGPSLHPRRHGELRAGRWELRVSASIDEGSYQDNWYWTIEYHAPYDEHPPQDKIYLRLQGELGEALRLEGDTRYLMELDRRDTYRILHWDGYCFEDVKAAQAWATRAFVESRPF